MDVQDLKERIKRAILNDDIAYIQFISEGTDVETYTDRSSVESYEENVAASGALERLADKFKQANANDNRASLYSVLAQVAFASACLYSRDGDFGYSNERERVERDELMAVKVADELADALFKDPEIQAKTFTFGPPE